MLMVGNGELPHPASDQSVFLFTQLFWRQRNFLPLIFEAKVEPVLRQPDHVI